MATFELLEPLALASTPLATLRLSSPLALASSPLAVLALKTPLALARSPAATLELRSPPALAERPVAVLLLLSPLGLRSCRENGQAVLQCPPRMKQRQTLWSSLRVQCIWPLRGRLSPWVLCQTFIAAASAASRLGEASLLA
jgi:hypothetical protein